MAETQANFRSSTLGCFVSLRQTKAKLRKGSFRESGEKWLQRSNQIGRRPPRAARQVDARRLDLRLGDQRLVAQDALGDEEPWAANRRVEGADLQRVVDSRRAAEVHRQPRHRERDRVGPV